MRVYLAGPMRGYPECNFPAFHEGTAVLRRQGHDVASPAEEDLKIGLDVTGFLTCSNEELSAIAFDLDETIRRDVHFVLWAEAIILLPGWEKSTGVAGELNLARWARRQVGQLIDGEVVWGDPAA